jgi:hypothetical protein
MNIQTNLQILYKAQRGLKIKYIITISNLYTLKPFKNEILNNQIAYNDQMAIHYDIITLSRTSITELHITSTPSLEYRK